MRRLLLVALLVAAFGAPGPLGAETAAAEPDRPATDARRGLVYDGIRRSAPTGACRGVFELDGQRDGAGRALCTHGPDPAPDGVDVRHPREFPPATADAGTTPASGTAAGSAVCDGDGTSGYRVQLLYVRASDVADRYSSLSDSFPQWAAQMDAVFNDSAAKTGGSRHVRFVHDSSCNVVVDSVTVGAADDDDFSATLQALRNQGYGRSDRKYLAWVDATRYCGIAQVYLDDRPTQDNASNGISTVPGELARVDSGCWGHSNSLEAHELMHTLGGVQRSAPNATANNHCTDESDRMCYKDDPGVTLRYTCASTQERLFDCNNDDYFHTRPATRSYLSYYWNTANSRFLIGAGTSTTTTTAIPASPTTTAPPPPMTTTTTTPTAPPTGSVPSAPQGLFSQQPQIGSGIVLSWSPPASSGGDPVTSYRVYRGASPTALSLLTTVGPSTGHADTAAARATLYYYQVSAVNGSGEGPRSNITRMIGK